ncbi:hypothetical protein [Halorubrum sp. DTA98]|uniref:hypothetical protein n=1 Tax=Halorubrum sp. DTA98 TaxID=3402163 RepID=UPI003AAD240B
MDPPSVPTDRLDGWRRVAETTEVPFSAGPVSVTAATVRFEPVDDADPRPFFFASRLRIEPSVAPNPVLTRLVERRARAGFRTRLADNDIRDVDHLDDREVRIDDPAASAAALSTFRGECTVADRSAAGGRTVPVEALLAVWSVDDYRLAGGAYPLVGDADRARRDLLRLIRGVRSAP